MSNTSIKITNLGKMYRLYKSPMDKIFDAFGLNFWRKNYYQEFWALKDLDLEIKKGERVGIVGRNGAGKSTLLKTIIGNVSPTEGQVKVNGRIQALMELGTGFHPEFTGRQNIHASLSYQGFSSEQIAQKEEEIVDFAELEEFIDQPLKTYSAGMYARLAFSAATAIEPDILIIDEVLGAGDAYFASKCVDKMKRLTSEAGATVLFVSHDMASVEMLCDKCIWIERGRKKMEGSASEVSKAYAQMIRQRTAQRIQAKNAMVSINETQSIRKLRENSLQLILRFVWVEGLPLEINSVELCCSGLKPIVVKVGEPQDNSYNYDGFVLIDNNFSQWGKPSQYNDGIYSRSIVAAYNRCSAVVFNLEGLSPTCDAEVSIKYINKGRSKARLEVYDGTVYRLLHEFELSSDSMQAQNAWMEWNGVIGVDLLESLIKSCGLIMSSQGNSITKGESKNDINFAKELINNEDDFGEIFQGNIVIKKVSFTNETGETSCLVKSFETFFVNIDYHVLQGPLEVEFVVCFHKMGMIALQAMSGLQEKGVLVVRGGQRSRCTLEIPHLPLGKGSYMVSVGIFPPLNYYSLDTEKMAYALHDRRYEIQVEQPENILIDLGMCRGQVRWLLNENALTNEGKK
ncbi:ABC transporter ATP-binding protein [Pelotomaculum propionicicum]|uniref:ABC transporter ATP-binding protein n=1 Tax=Pelotomaculum propionicicum TaxID=258475 RepID=UPI003B78EDF7